MKSTAFLIVVTSLLAACATVPSTTADVSGRWESTTTSEGALGAVFDLGADGTLVAGVSVLLDARYALDGDHLTIRTPDHGDLPPQDVRFEGDRLIVGTGESRRADVAAPDAPPIVGVWATPHRAGGTAFERYTTNGRFSFRLAMPGEKRGTWSVASGLITMTIDGTSQDFAASRSGDTLTLTLAGPPESKPQKFRRAERWYAFPAGADGF